MTINAMAASTKNLIESLRSRNLGAAKSFLKTNPDAAKSAQAGGDAKLRDKAGKTTLDIARERGRPKLVRLLGGTY